jgi:hypothetical protein
MRRNHSSIWHVALGVAGAAALLVGCSDSFDNPFAGTCSATHAPAASQAGDPAGSYRLEVRSQCYSGPTFGTFHSDGEWLIVPGIADSVTLSFVGGYINATGDTLSLSIQGAGGMIPGEDILVFSGRETFLGGSAGFGSSSGSATLTNGTFGPGTAGGWAFNGTLTADNDTFEY